MRQGVDDVAGEALQAQLKNLEQTDGACADDDSIRLFHPVLQTLN